MPKVSVVIPIYNVEKFLKRSLDSVCGQTLEDIEIICINDCSTDNSLEILQEYAKNDNRIKIINFEKNLGVSVARNAGIKCANGEYLGFVDSDDYIDLNFYEQLYKKAKEDNFDIVKGNVSRYRLDGKILKSTELTNLINKNKFYFLCDWWSAIYKTTLVIDNKIIFPEECPKAQDIVFLNRCILKCKKLAAENTVFYHYMRRENSLDSCKLPNKYAYSAIKAGEIILNELNDAYLAGLINDADYTYVYTKKIIGVWVYTYYMTFDLDVKKYCSFMILEYYNKCFKKDLFNQIFEYQSLLSVMKNNTVEEVCSYLDKYPNVELCAKAELLFNLRKNVKREIKNA